MDKLKQLIEKYGKNKINSLTKYPSILTLHELGGKGKLTDILTTDIKNETLYPVSYTHLTLPTRDDG